MRCPPDRGCIDFLSGKRRVFVGYSLTDEDFVHIYELVRQRLADTPKRSYIVTLDERVNSDTHPDASPGLGQNRRRSTCVTTPRSSTPIPTRMN